MGEKTEAEGGGNTRRRSERLRKEREAAEAVRRAEAKKPMRNTGMSDRQMIAQSDRTPNLSRANSAAAARSAAMAANRAAIEELTARRDDTRNPISRMNLDNQIRELKAGGTPVQTTFAAGGSRAGEILTVGVVRGGRFSGRQGFDPSTGATKMDRFAGAYRTRAGTRGGVSTGGGDSSPTTPATTPSTTIQDATNRTVSSGTDDPVRLAQLSTVSASGKRRILLGTASA